MRRLPRGRRAFPEVQVSAVRDRTSDRGPVTLLVGDAAKLPLEAETMDCIVTSPPYNVGMDYGTSDSLNAETYQARAYLWANEMHRVLRDNRRLWLNVVPSATIDDHERPAGWHSGRTKAPRLPLLHVWQTALELSGFNLIDVIAWTRVGNNSTAWGSFQSPASPNLRGDWESIIVACKGEWARDTPEEHRNWKDNFGTWPQLASTVWAFPPAQRVDHPAPFPVELPRRCIRLSTWPGETVLDPFCGSGTTVRAAVELDREGIGIDLSPIFIARARERGVQHTLDPS